MHNRHQRKEHFWRNFMIDSAILVIVELLLLSTCENNIKESSYFLLIPCPVFEFDGFSFIIFIKALFYKFMRVYLFWKTLYALNFLSVVARRTIVRNIWENNSDIFSWNKAIGIEIIPINEVRISIKYIIFIRLKSISNWII